MDFSFSLIELGLMILLFIVAGLSVKQVTNKWRVLYAAPTFFALTLVILDGFDYFHIFLYLGTALQIVALFSAGGAVHLSDVKVNASFLPLVLKDRCHHQVFAVVGDDDEVQLQVGHAGLGK